MLYFLLPTYITIQMDFTTDNCTLCSVRVSAKCQAMHKHYTNTELIWMLYCVIDWLSKKGYRGIQSLEVNLDNNMSSYQYQTRHLGNRIVHLARCHLMLTGEEQVVKQNGQQSCQNTGNEGDCSFYSSSEAYQSISPSLRTWSRWFIHSIVTSKVTRAPDGLEHLCDLCLGQIHEKDMLNTINPYS